MTRKHFEPRTGRTALDDSHHFVGLSRMLALARADEIYLSTPRLYSTDIFAAYPKENEFESYTKPRYSYK
jgi:hypothetical protein